MWKENNAVRPHAIKLLETVQARDVEAITGDGISAILFLAREGFRMAQELERLSETTFRKCATQGRAILRKWGRLADEEGAAKRAKRARDDLAGTRAMGEAPTKKWASSSARVLPLVTTGPAKAMAESRFARLSENELEGAKTEVWQALMIEGAPKSRPAYNSAMNSWEDFCVNVLKLPHAIIPPKIEENARHVLKIPFGPKVGVPARSGRRVRLR
jgi:hypothetical protein